MGLLTKDMDRRDFFSLGVAPIGAFLILQKPASKMIPLPADAAGFTPNFVGDALDKIREVAENPGRAVHLQFRDTAGVTRSVSLSFERVGSQSPIRPTLRDENNRPLYLIHDGKNPLHRTQFFSPDDEMFDRLKKRLRRLWEGLQNYVQRQDSVTLAIKVAAAALVIWLAASVGKVVLAGLAFFAAYAIIIGLVIIGGIVVTQLIRGHASIPALKQGARKLFIDRSKTFPSIVAAIEA